MRRRRTGGASSLRSGRFEQKRLVHDRVRDTCVRLGQRGRDHSAHGGDCREDVERDLEAVRQSSRRERARQRMRVHVVAS